MHDSLPSKSYRSLLAELNGKGFSESTVQDVLKQILPPLAQLHSSGQVHGSISLDTIVQANNTAQLTPSLVPQMPSVALIVKDISDLGQVLAELLTGKVGIQGDIDDHCMVSDQILELITAMMQNSRTGQFRSAIEVQAQLYPQAVPIAQYSQPQGYTVPTPVYIPSPTNIQYGQPTQIQNNIPPFVKQNQQLIIAIASGLILGLVGVFAFLSINKSQNPQPVASSPPVTNIETPPVTPTAPVAPAPIPTPTVITEEEARQVVANWLNAKSRIFAPPYDRNLAFQLSTGELYNDIVKSNGSIDWLSRNNAYYSFSNHSATSLGGFVGNQNDAVILVRVTENKTLFVRGKVDPTQTSSDSRMVRYFLNRENGTWKIRDFKLIPDRE